MEDLGQLIFVVLFILFGLISSSRKKARPNRGSVKTAPPAEPAEAVPPLQREAAGQDEESAQPESTLGEELLALLQAEAQPAVEPVVTLPDVDDEAQSIETLEPAGIESHKKFREMYVEEVATDETTAERPYDVPARSGRRKQLSRRVLQHAFVMKEVLGPPKALE